MNAKILAFAFVVIVLVAAAPLIASSLKEPEIIVSEAAIEIPPPQEPAAPRPMMTRDQFFRIPMGMSYAQSIQIAGGKGVESNASRQGAQGVTKSLTWYDADGRTEFSIGFRNGRVASKNMGATREHNARAGKRLRDLEAQTREIGISEARRYERQALNAGKTLVITVAEYEKIRAGIAYNECVAIIGKEHPGARSFGAQRGAVLGGQAARNQSLIEAYRWLNPGGYFAEITFKNGRVTAKTWKHRPPQ